MWNPSHDANITVTISGIQLKADYWNITHLNLQILDAVLPDLNLQINNELTRKLYVLVSNSTIRNLIGGYIDLKVINTSITHPRESTAALFYIYDRSHIIIADSVFSNFNVDEKGDNIAVSILFVVNSLVEIQSSTFSFNNASWSNIYVYESDMFVISSIFFGNKAFNSSSCILGVKSNISIADSMFRENKAINWGAIKVQNESSLTVNNCTFEQNSATGFEAEGGAIAGIFDVEITIQKSDFTGNRVMNGFGGAIYVINNSVLVLDSSLFQGNLAAQGGAINAQQDTHVIVKNTNFLRNGARWANGNTADIELLAENFLMKLTSKGTNANTQNSNVIQAEGGAVDCGIRSTLLILSSYFDGNFAKEGWGGAMHIWDCVDLNISDSIFTRNTASQGGCLNAKDDVNLMIINTSFTYNSALPVLKKDGQGGAIRGVNKVQFYIRSSILKNNSALYGGGIVLKQNVSATVANTSFQHNSCYTIKELHSVKGMGGAIYLENGIILSVVSSHFEDNQAVQGGAVIALYSVKLSIVSTTFLNNLAAIQYGPGFPKSYADSTSVIGGAISSLFDNTLSIQSSCFISNEARGKGASTESDIHLLDSIIQNNKASRSGGVLYMLSGNISIWNNTFISNRAGHFGGVICVNSIGYSSLYIVNTSFQYNQANTKGDVIYITTETHTAIKYIILDFCSITENIGQNGTALYLRGCLSLQMARCNITYHDSNNGTSIDINTLGFPFTFITYKVIISNAAFVIRSSDPNFLHKAASRDDVGSESNDMKMYINSTTEEFRHEETPYAAGMYTEWTFP